MAPGRTVEECDYMIRRALQSPMVKYLITHLEKAGCGVGENFIKAVHCDEMYAGGYVPGRGIHICSNHMQYQDYVNQVVAHELIHAYDDCVAKNLKWSNCAHHACSEIRANNLSGDCHFKRELLRGWFKFKGHGKECVRRRALQSVCNNSNCSEKASKDAVEAVWDVCYNDTRPFDRVP